MKHPLLFFFALIMFTSCFNEPPKEANRDQKSIENLPSGNDTTSRYIRKETEQMTYSRRDAILYDISPSFKGHTEPLTTEHLNILVNYYKKNDGIKELAVIIIENKTSVSIRYVDSPLIAIPVQQINMEDPLTEISTERVNIVRIKDFNNQISKSNAARFLAFTTLVSDAVKHKAKGSDISNSLSHLTTYFNEPVKYPAPDFASHALIATDFINTTGKLSKFDLKNVNIIIAGCPLSSAEKYITSSNIYTTETFRSAIEHSIN